MTTDEHIKSLEASLKEAEADVAHAQKRADNFRNAEKETAPDGSSIIDLATGEPVTLVKRQDGYCMSRCQNVLVDQHKRELTCRECGAVVDPFAWAVRMAIEESHLLSRINSLKIQADEHEKRVVELKAEEQRVKTRVRAAKDSLLRSAGI